MSTQAVTAKFAWHELYTTDVAKAVEFYSGLLGGETTSHGEYTMLRANGREQFGIVLNDHAGVPSHWYPYVHVDDADAAVERATGLGARALHGPQTVEGMVRFAVLADPQGATFGVFQPLGEGDAEQESLVAWNELLTSDRDGAFAFYGELFGWTTSPFGSDEYHVFGAGETTVGGVMAKPDQAPTSTWLLYLSTKDVDASVKRGEELGATVVYPAMSMENVGRFAVLADPTGAAFGLHANE